MNGPELESLTRRLAECPPEHLAEPKIGGRGQVEVAAVIADLLRDLAAGPHGPPAIPNVDVRPFLGSDARARNRLRTLLVAAWLLGDEWFRARGPELAGPAEQLLAGGLDDLAQVVDAERLVHDVDRREELARLVLARLGLRPAGESSAEAEDRLATLDSTERVKLAKEARKREARRREVIAALERKAAEEAAAKVSRE